MKPYYEENGITIYNAAERARRDIIGAWANEKGISKHPSISLSESGLVRRTRTGKATRLQSAAGALGRCVFIRTWGLVCCAATRGLNGTI
jgi:hypothetical protein